MHPRAEGVRLLEFQKSTGIIHGTAQALVISDVAVEDYQTPFWTDPGPQHADAIGLLRGDGVGLLQQQGARKELGCWAEPHQDVCRGGIVEACCWLLKLPFSIFMSLLRFSVSSVIEICHQQGVQPSFRVSAKLRGVESVQQRYRYQDNSCFDYKNKGERL